MSLLQTQLWGRAANPAALHSPHYASKGRDEASSNASGAEIHGLVILAVFTPGVGILFIKEGHRVTYEPDWSQICMQWAQAGAEVEAGDAVTGTAGCIKPGTSTKAQVWS